MLNICLSTLVFSKGWLYKDLQSEHQVLLFYIKVRWLSKCKVLNRDFEFIQEIKMVLDMQNKEPIYNTYRPLFNVINENVELIVF